MAFPRRLASFLGHSEMAISGLGPVFAVGATVVLWPPQILVAPAGKSQPRPWRASRRLLSCDANRVQGTGKLQIQE
jgi:hypothetical protein